MDGERILTGFIFVLALLTETSSFNAAKTVVFGFYSSSLNVNSFLKFTSRFLRQQVRLDTIFQTRSSRRSMSIYLRQRPRDIFGVLEVVVSLPTSPRRFGTFLEHIFSLCRTKKGKKTEGLKTKLSNHSKTTQQ